MRHPRTPKGLRSIQPKRTGATFEKAAPFCISSLTQVPADIGNVNLVEIKHPDISHEQLRSVLLLRRAAEHTALACEVESAKVIEMLSKGARVAPGPLEASIVEERLPCGVLRRLVVTGVY